MSLPNPGMSFTPFDQLPASSLNDMVENIESLADGSGLDIGAVTASKIDFTSFVSFLVASTNATANQSLTASGSSTVNVSSNNPALELKPGNYLLWASASCRAIIAGQDSSIGVRIWNNTASSSVIARSYSSTGISQTLWPTMYVTDTVVVASNTTYSAQLTQSFGTGTGYTFVQSSLIAIPLKTTG